MVHLIQFTNCILVATFNRQYMIYPQEDEYQKTSFDQQQIYPFNLTNLKQFSPILPMHFDRRFLPRDLCEKELLSVSECLLLYNIEQEQLQNMCTLQSSKFQSCRRRRDTRILGAINRWEKQHVSALDQQNQGMYLMGLGRKLTRLEEEFKRQPSTVTGLNRAERMEFEIKQIRWRLDYLNKMKSQII